MVPWFPVIPTKKVPLRAGGDTSPSGNGGARDGHVPGQASGTGLDDLIAETASLTVGPKMPVSVPGPKFGHGLPCSPHHGQAREVKGAEGTSEASLPLTLWAAVILEPPSSI